MSNVEPARDHLEAIMQLFNKGLVTADYVFNKAIKYTKEESKDQIFGIDVAADDILGEQNVGED